MMVLPPVAGINAGTTNGGGLIDTFKNTIAGITGGSTAPGGTTQVAPGPKGDGSVGLFDGVLGKAALGGAAGAAIGFIPFIPGGPILGGVLGALSGAAMGVFGNWMKISAIKKENEAMVAALGVQAQDPQVQQILQSGNVEQLIPYMQQQQAMAMQQGGSATQTATDPAALAQGQAALPTQATGLPAQSGGEEPDIRQVTDPDTGVTQLIDVKNGVLVQDATGAGPVPEAAQQQLAQQAPLSGAQGGGGAAGDAGRPPAPVGVEGSSVTAIAGLAAPTSGVTAVAGLAAPTSGTTALASEEAATGTELLQSTPSSSSASGLNSLVEQLKRQVEILERFIESLKTDEQPAAA